jgi:signal transduction histidine kinase
VGALFFLTGKLFDTIFKKQFILFICVIIACFYFLGFALMFAVNQLFIEDAKREMIRLAAAAREIYADAFARSGEDKSIEEIRDAVADELRSVEKIAGAHMLVANENGLVVFNSDDALVNLGNPPTLSIISNLSIESYRKDTNIGGYLKNKSVASATAIWVANVNKGFVIFVSSMPDIQKNATSISRIMIGASAALVAAAGVVMFISGKSINAPLVEMNDAAKVIASGDFEKRIDIESSDEIGQLAKSFNLMAESLQKQEIQRRNFIANVSHDLRSPLTSMRGFLTAILDGTIPERRQERYLKIILEETDRLSKLANDILDISRLEKTELHITTFDVNALIKKIAAQFETRIVEKKITLTVALEDDLCPARADLEKVQRIIHNLLDNAVKFTNDEGWIKIETSVLHNKAYVSVADNGIGISKEDQRSVFDRFYKADASRGQDKKGSGLGLSIVREFVKAHGESITINSEKGEGTEIIFTLTLGQLNEGAIL